MDELDNLLQHELRVLRHVEGVTGVSVGARGRHRRRTLRVPPAAEWGGSGARRGRRPALGRGVPAPRLTLSGGSCAPYSGYVPGVCTAELVLSLCTRTPPQRVLHVVPQC